MDKICDKKIFKVGGQWPLCGMKKPNDQAEQTKVEC
mgnify:CR=1 FL=1